MAVGQESTITVLLLTTDMVLKATLDSTRVQMFDAV